MAVAVRVAEEVGHGGEARQTAAHGACRGEGEEEQGGERSQPRVHSPPRTGSVRRRVPKKPGLACKLLYKR